jgi:hypothetical protein
MLAYFVLVYNEKKSFITLDEGMDLPELPVENVSEEIERHLREINFQVSFNSSPQIGNQK